MDTKYLYHMTATQITNLDVFTCSSKEVAKQTFQLHYNYCVKNIQKCPFCTLPVAKAEMVDHLEQMKGND